MWEIFEKLRKQKKVSAYEVCKAIGEPSGMISNWKAGRYTPKADKLQKIADYFGVTLDYLMTGQEPAAGSGSGSSPSPSRYTFIIKRLDLLNDEGLSKVMDYTNDLVETGKYAVNAAKKEA